jgi:hypothetical protein
MVINDREMQNRRINSRVIAHLDCRITHGGASYDAVIVDLSQKGALMASKFLPPTGSEISIILQTQLLKNTLILSGTVLREIQIRPEDGPLCRFAVQFGHTPLDLIILLNKLLASQP